MKYTAILLCILLMAAIVLPASGRVTAESPLIGGVTLEPTKEPTTEKTPEPTTERTAEPTKEPTTEKTAEPGPQVGWVTIASTPSGAATKLDGKSIGVTPLSGIEVGAGKSHTVHISMTGYEPYEDSITVSAGEQAAVDADLKQIATPTPTPTPEPTITIGPIGGDKGWYRINCNVNGARAVLDNGAGGACTISGGSCSIEVSTTGSPVSTFTVSKAGYYTVTNPVSQYPGKGQTIELYATLNPEPQPTYGSIHVASSPSNAIAYLDGLTWQYTPCTFTALTAGTNHQVQISRSGYQTYTTTVTVPSGQTAYVDANLIPTPSRYGSLYVETTPKSADIYVDGRYIAQSPSVVPSLVPGTHSVRLHKAGYNEYVGTFTVYAGEQTPVTVTLSPQSGNVGSIEVSSVPPGSALYLDTNYMGLTPTNDYFDLTSLAPGSHTILLRHTDYQDYTQTVYVPAGGTITVNANLAAIVPGPTPDTTGQVVIASSPSGAEVLVDNVYKGVTPVTLSDISSGPHTLTLKLSGYQDSVQTITVTGGASTPVAVTMTQAAPTQTKSPLSVVPVLGAILSIGAVIFLRRH
jgi:hypothetical protein